MSSSTKNLLSLPRLQGSANYPIWKVRVLAYLIKEGHLDYISKEPESPDQLEKTKKALAEIQLLCEDGPLIQIKNAESAYKAWTTLEQIYNPTGFSSKFLLTKEFFSSTLDRFFSIEEFLNKVKELDNELSTRDLKLPRTIIIAQVLSNLGDTFKGFVANITAELRRNSNAYTFDSLISAILDEARRLDYSPNQAFFSSSFSNNSYKGKRLWKATKGKYYKNCKKEGHIELNCWFLFPKKALNNWDNKVSKPYKNPRNQHSKAEEREQIQEAFIAKRALKEDLETSYPNSANSNQSEYQNQDITILYSNIDLIDLDFDKVYPNN